MSAISAQPQPSTPAWRILAKQASEEQDGKKLSDLVEQLLKVLDEESKIGQKKGTA
jgi:hypothetical protein